MAARVQVRAKVYRGQEGFHVIECGRGGFGASIFCLTLEGAKVIKAAVQFEIAARRLMGREQIEARATRREAQDVISAVLRSGF